jgi:antitoxin (DNA-binding transcriptional repressor) of toxin-antitoxin stability system
MTSMTVRDVRLHWPAAEKALAQGEEIVVTRDAKPVARLVPFISATHRPRPPFNPEMHLRRLRRFWKNQPTQPSTDNLLTQDRSDGAD